MFGILRTLLAINVMLLHIFSVPSLGNYSVSFFFILSGFLMTYISHNTYGYNYKGFKLFWVNRVLRLFPVYWFIFALTILFILVFPKATSTVKAVFIPTSILEWLSNITMIFPEIVPHRFSPRVVPTSWALTNELLFYFLISLGISKTRFRTLIWVGLSIGYYIFTYIFYDIPTYRYSAVFASSLPFSLGALLFWIIDLYKPKAYRFSYVIYIYILFIINAIVTFYMSSLVREISIYINMILAMVLIYCLFNISSDKKLRNFDKKIGMYSYPIYLSHYLVAFFYITFVNIGVLKNSFKMELKALPIYGLMLFVFCYLVVVLIDKKVDKLKNVIKKKHKLKSIRIK
ncbi:MAG: acyltransferase [Winogradskyella sp.]|uniref:acyltransferase family protein n=1 Tax=Winogradskyella sp. TaxID=1883156 RepID=UPI000F3C1A90|nr:acyltransferase [Winogradskyella sp.]RNC86882.1 MAG: acyltransferase [Winogradskyella sp.]